MRREARKVAATSRRPSLGVPWIGFAAVAAVWAGAMPSAASPLETIAPESFDVEIAAVRNAYNDVRVPNEGGTDISLTDDLEASSARCFRLRLEWELSERSQLSALIAPLRIASAGRPASEVDFAGVRYPAGARIEARYQFDSYRLTYRYALHRGRRWEIDVGATAKIRDAKILFESQELGSQTTDTGFVPLLHVRAGYRFHPGWRLLFEADALAAPQGRAEDVFVGGQYVATPHLSVRGGYRLLEGGADVDQVYNFALIHYASLGFTYTF